MVVYTKVIYNTLLQSSTPFYIIQDLPFVRGDLSLTFYQRNSVILRNLRTSYGKRLSDTRRLIVDQTIQVDFPTFPKSKRDLLLSYDMSERSRGKVRQNMDCLYSQVVFESIIKISVDGGPIEVNLYRIIGLRVEGVSTLIGRDRDRN